MIGISITRKTTKIIGIALIVIGLSLFGISYNQGSMGQDRYSEFMCAVDATPKACTTANNQMTGGFIGMIFGFFVALFGSSLVVPSTLLKIIKKVKR
ncbi:MAG: hypothetical protein WB988_18535 [Candidatus Nitrosopolaris sp.]|jgi:hypothetical protein